MSHSDNSKEKCEWVTDSKSGDLVMKCFDGHEGARVPKEVVETSEIHNSENQVIAVDRLKKHLEKELNCKLDDCCSQPESSNNTAATHKATMLCYCFGFTWQDYYDDPAVREYVIEQTKNGNCECSTKNPSGQCCLKDFPKNK